MGREVKPSCHPRLAALCIDEVPPWIQRLPTAELQRILTLPGTGHALPRAVRLELGIREQMAEELLDPHLATILVRGDGSGDPERDLSVVRLESPPRDHEDSAKCYGEQAATSARNVWYVECRKGRWPWRGILPLGFDSRGQAEMAMRSLEAAGFGTEALLRQRLHVEKDWQSVKHIMLKALGSGPSD